MQLRTTDSDLATFLDGDSDSDVNLPPKERVNQRIGWINQDYRDMVSWNASFRCSSQPWEQYLRDQMHEHGYIKRNNQWVKTGPPSRNNENRRQEAVRRLEERKERKERMAAKSMNPSADSSKGSKGTHHPKPKTHTTKKATMKKPSASKTVMKVLTKSMKRLKVNKSSSSTLGMSMKSQSVVKKSPKKSTPPGTPKKKKEVLDVPDKTPSPKAVLNTPPKMDKSKRRFLGLSRSSPVTPHK